MPAADFLAHHSIYVENVMRHCFLYEVTRVLVTREEPLMVTILNAEVDNEGVDIVLTLGSITRHIQMKTMAKKDKGRTVARTGYNIAEVLGTLPGGCVLWLVYDRETMRPECYHLMGGKGNETMDSLSKAPVGRKRRKGVRVERAGYRQVKMSDAEHKGLTVDRLVDVLFNL
jgi:hypothetical protein